VRHHEQTFRALRGRFVGANGRVTLDNVGTQWTLLVNQKPVQSLGCTAKSLERATGIEPAFSAWEADVLPLNYARVALIVVPFRFLLGVAAAAAIRHG